MSTHAKLSSSATKQWWACPGSLAYQLANEVASTSSYHSQLGTAAHLLLETALREGEQPGDYLGCRVDILRPDTDEEEEEEEEEEVIFARPSDPAPDEKNSVSFPVDSDMAFAVTQATDYVHRRLKELGVTMKSVRLESWVNPLPDRKDTGGTADIIIDAWPDVLEVFDYKHGAGVYVPVENNKQLRSYALGALREVGGTDYASVRYTIGQPRHPQAPANGISSEDISVDDLLQWGEELAKAANRVDKARKIVSNNGGLEALFKNGLLSVGDDGSHCTFCPLSYRCPAVLDRVQREAQVDFSEEPEVIPVPEDTEALANLLQWVPFVKKFLEAVTSKAESVALSGGEVRGYKLVLGRSNRTWVGRPEAELAEELTKRFDLSKEDIFCEPKLRTGPQVEKLLPKEHRDVLNSEFLHKPDGKPTLVPESDKRPAVTVNPASDFEDVED